MISPPSDKTGRNSTEKIRPNYESGVASDVFSDILKMLADLETSLQNSQDALLLRDVARLEDLTREQSSLRRCILPHWKELLTTGSENPARRENLRDSALQPAAEIRDAAMRVLRLGRVQRILLERMQQLLRVSENVALTPQAGYNPSPAWGPIRRERSPSASVEA